MYEHFYGEENAVSVIQGVKPLSGPALKNSTCDVREEKQLGTCLAPVKGGCNVLINQ